MSPSAHYSCFLRRIWKHMCWIKIEFMFQGYIRILYTDSLSLNAYSVTYTIG